MVAALGWCEGAFLRMFGMWGMWWDWHAGGGRGMGVGVEFWGGGRGEGMKKGLSVP